MTQQQEILTGHSETHLVEIPGSGIKIHKEVLAPFEKMAKAALAAGFEMKIVSGFRGFQSQMGIWNAKATGKRVLLDSSGKPTDFASLKPKQLVHVILRWSALPGASRHHWGTDFDVIDQLAVPDGYKVQLVPSEYATGGIFAGLNQWMDQNLEKFGFFRPYAKDLGGVSPEAWHISYASLSRGFLKGLTLDLLEKVVEDSEMELKDMVLAELKSIFEKYVKNIS